MTQLELEKTVMEHLLAGDDKHVPGLVKQFNSAEVVKREFTGRGFFAEYKYPDNLKIGNISGTITDVYVDYKDEDDGMGFVLFLNDGGIDTLEGFSYIEDWHEKDIDKIDETSFFCKKPDVYIKENNGSKL